MKIGDAEVYVAALIAVLIRHSEGVILAVTEPATGLPSRCRWPPSVAELAEACEALASSKEGVRTFDDAVRETLSRRRDPGFDVPRIGHASDSESEYAAFRRGERGRGTRDQRTRRIGEVLRKHGFTDLASKFDG